MAHEIETMAYAGEKPWHGLGKEISPDISLDDMVKEAGLDWEINKVPVYAQIQGEGLKQIEDKYALIRNTDNKVMDIAGKDYKPLQNKEALEFFRDFLESGDMKLETAGSLKEGRVIWGLARLQNDVILKAHGKDDISEGYLLVSTGHEVGKALSIKLTTVRVVCNNTLTLSLNKGSEIGGVFRMTHRAEFTDELRAYAKGLVTNCAMSLEEYQREAQKLYEVDLSFDEGLSILASVYQPEEFKRDNEVKDLIHRFDDIANRTLKNIRQAYNLQPRISTNSRSAFDLLNAVTFYNTHMQGRNTDGRAYANWYGNNAVMANKVKGKLLSLAA